MKAVLLSILAIILFNLCYAQIDIDCTGGNLHSIYLCSSNPVGIYRIDSVDTNPTTPTLLTANLPDIAGGISINDNLNSPGSPQTMYYIGSTSSLYHYWNGSSWTNTNHYCGSQDALNIGGTSSYIFNLDANLNNLYRYDGNGSGTLLLSNLNIFLSAIYDVATDNMGNFYIFYTNLQKIVSYSSAGAAIDTFNTTGFPALPQPGFAILNNKMYAFSNFDMNSTNLYEGVQTGNTINFTYKAYIPLRVTDIAACPQAGKPVTVPKINDKATVSISPNPFQNEIYIQIKSRSSLEFTIYALTSEIVHQQIFNSEVKINVEHILKGVYIYEFKNNSGVIERGKLVKH